MKKNILLSVVASVYNEEAVIKQFVDVTKQQLDNLNISYEIILVNDGSSDNSKNIINKTVKETKNIRAIHFSRNFGHESAMIAGIDHALGKAIICLDADLQHPPSIIGEMLEKFHQGYEIINMVCTKREDLGWFKKLTSKYFYVLLNKISTIKIQTNASDFFLISHRVATILRGNFREKNRFLRGFIQQVGFKKTTIEFTAPKRAGGQSKYSFYKLLIFSAQAIATSSQIPLRLSILVGVIFSLFSFIVGIYSVIMKLFGSPFSGYTTIVVLISFAFGIQFFILGIIGEYIGYIFTEHRKHPLYIIEEMSSS